MSIPFRHCAISLVLGAAGMSASAAVVQSTDFIGAGYSHFNGFEGAIAQISGAYPGGSYTEDTLRVEQVPWSGNSISIRTTNFGTGFTGQVWGPPGGDLAYTRITQSGGGDFSDVGLQVGSAYTHPGNGSSSLYLYFELFDNGAMVQSGTLLHQTAAHWLGFSGGGFDEIRVRDWDFNFSGMNTGNGANGLIVDSIKIAGDSPPSVPEPGSLALAALSLGLLARTRRNQR
jgi:hypothetical protein